MELAAMTSDEVREYVSSGSGVIILPMGSTEEHGPHGPLGTDTFAATAVSEAVASLLDAVVAPPLPYGMSMHEAKYFGTIGLLPSTVSLLVRELCSRFVWSGFNLILVLSGHRGNDHAAMNGMQEAILGSEVHGLYMCYQDANRGRLGTVVGDGAAGMPVTPDDERYGADGHGGSVEMSVAMAFRPDAVRLTKREVPDRSYADALRSFPFRAVLSVEEYSPTKGVFGDPSYCSEELGKRVVKSTAARIAEEVRRYLEVFPARGRVLDTTLRPVREVHHA